MAHMSTRERTEERITETAVIEEVACALKATYENGRPCMALHTTRKTSLAIQSGAALPKAFGPSGHAPSGALVIAQTI